jgi:hypothetical protein
MAGRNVPNQVPSVGSNNSTGRRWHDVPALNTGAFDPGVTLVRGPQVEAYHLLKES